MIVVPAPTVTPWLTVMLLAASPSAPPASPQVLEIAMFAASTFITVPISTSPVLACQVVNDPIEIVVSKSAERFATAALRSMSPPVFSTATSLDCSDWVASTSIPCCDMTVTPSATCSIAVGI